MYYLDTSILAAYYCPEPEKNLSPEDGNKIFNQFQTHLKESLFRLITVEDRHYQTAKKWILQFAVPLKTLDALHLAIAAEGDLTLLTADRQLVKSAKYFGINVVTLSSYK
jgi:predicted nucleic acid-binding protein